MTYFFEAQHIKLPKGKDRRVKLSEKDKSKIRNLYFVDHLTIRHIARMYKAIVCRRTIQFVLFPDRLKTVNFSGHWKKYYNREKRAEVMREHRHYKKSILEGGNKNDKSTC